MIHVVICNCCHPTGPQQQIENLRKTVRELQAQLIARDSVSGAHKSNDVLLAKNTLERAEKMEASVAELREQLEQRLHQTPTLVAKAEARYQQQKTQGTALLEQIKTMKLRSANMAVKLQTPLRRIAELEGVVAGLKERNLMTIGVLKGRSHERIVALEDQVSRLKFQHSQLLDKKRTRRGDSEAKIDTSNVVSMNLSIAVISFVVLIVLLSLLFKLRDCMFDRKGKKHRSSSTV